VVSVLWLGAWTWIRGAFTVWLIMLAVYMVVLAVTIVLAPTSRRTPALHEWQARFFETSGWLVLSGLLSLSYILVVSLVFLIIGLLTGSV
jgi:hypothetical protein